MTYETELADSDSVNLGSNPSSPATEILDVAAISDPGQIGHLGQTAHSGRTEPGTAGTGLRLLAQIRKRAAELAGDSTDPTVRALALQVACDEAVPADIRGLPEFQISIATTRAEFDAAKGGGQ
jgi:hypothetical protein